MKTCVLLSLFLMCWVTLAQAGEVWYLRCPEAKGGTTFTNLPALAANQGCRLVGVLNMGGGVQTAAAQPAADGTPATRNGPVGESGE